MDDDEEPGRIPAKPRIYNDDELQIINQKSVARLQQKNDPSPKTKVTITTSKPNAAPQHQVIYPLPRIPSRSHQCSEPPAIRASDSVVSETATQTSESGYSSAQTGYSSAQTQKMGPRTAKSRKTTLPKKKKIDPVVTRAVLDLIKEGLEYYHDGKYANSMTSFKSVMKSQMIRKAQSDNPLVANMLANIGTIYLRQERYDHAIEALEKAERMMRRSAAEHKNNANQQVVPTNVPLAWVLNNLATAKCLRGEHKASLEYYWEAIKDAKKRDRESSKKEVANALYNVGRIGVLRKDYPMALGALKKSLEVETKLCGPKSIELVDTLNLIGFVHYSTGEFEKAISVFTDALSNITGAFGSVHEQVAVSLTNVGMVLEKEGDLTESLRCFVTARSVCEKVGLAESHSTMHTAIRSANDIRRKLSLVQDIAPSIQKKESMGTAEVREGPSSDRPSSFDRARQVFTAQEGRSFDQIRKTFSGQKNESKETISRVQIRRGSKIDMKTYAASIDQRRKAIPSSSTPPVSINNTPKKNDPNLTVRSEGKEVDVQTYAAYKDRLKTENTTMEHREDPMWEYDNSSLIEEEVRND